MGITHEIAGTAEDITWKNITVIRFDGYVNDNPFALTRAPIFMRAAHGGVVKNLLFENILIEGARSKLLTIGNEPVEGFGTATISDITFKNIVAHGIADPKLTIVDESGEGIIRGIHFENVTLNGERLAGGDDRFYVRGAEDISVR